MGQICREEKNKNPRKIFNPKIKEAELLFNPLISLMASNGSGWHKDNVIKQHIIGVYMDGYCVCFLVEAFAWGLKKTFSSIQRRKDGDNRLYIILVPIYSFINTTSYSLGPKYWYFYSILIDLRRGNFVNPELGYNTSIVLSLNMTHYNKRSNW